ncbi:cell envelope integrity protein TolA [Variovorax sp. RHLX14]|uniref:cell envelope integrity protein TolA n=1 Tax=Variovorax sp. RHLX14 TaxID=1259731 RepID=UPI003F457245
MSLAADRPEFAPPPQRGTPRAIVFALLAHVVLIAALTWGVHWKRDAEDDAVEAEIWSTTVQQAAPRLSQPPAPTPVPVTPPPPPPAPAPRPAPPPPPPPPPAPAVRTPEPAPRAPDIALEREKKAKEQKERELEQAKQEKKIEAAKKAAQEKKELEAKQRAEEEAQDRKEAQQKALADARKKKEAEQKQAEAKQAQLEAAKKKEADAAKQAQAEAAKKNAAAEASKQAAADRAATLKRMQGMAGASGGETATGNALKSSGPSGSYGARVAAAVRPNIVFPDADLVNGNPKAEFEVTLAPDGTIVGVKLVKSSGLPNWDQAAERGLRKTDKLPRDNDGRIFPSLIVALQPKR